MTVASPPADRGSSPLTVLPFPWLPFREPLSPSRPAATSSSVVQPSPATITLQGGGPGRGPCPPPWRPSGQAVPTRHPLTLRAGAGLFPRFPASPWRLPNLLRLRSLRSLPRHQQTPQFPACPSPCSTCWLLAIRDPCSTLQPPSPLQLRPIPSCCFFLRLRCPAPACLPDPGSRAPFLHLSGAFSSGAAGPPRGVNFQAGRSALLPWDRRQLVRAPPVGGRPAVCRPEGLSFVI